MTDKSRSAKVGTQDLEKKESECFVFVFSLNFICVWLVYEQWCDTRCTTGLLT